MEINDGMYIGANPAAVRSGVKSYAKNIMYNDDGNTLINENGFEQIDVSKKANDLFKLIGINNENTSGNTYKCIGNITTPKGLILFYYNGIKDNQKIIYIKDTSKGLEFDDKEKINNIVVLQGNFNFDINRPITGTYSYIRNDKIFITFTEGVKEDANETRIIYLDDIDTTLDITKDDNETEYDLYILKEDNIDLLNLIPNIEYPTITIKTTKGGLKAGGYQVAVALKLNDDSYSDYSILSPVHYATPDYGDNIPLGGITDKGLEIKLDFHKTPYKKFKLAFVYKSESTEQAYESYDIDINENENDNTVIITSVNNLKSISINDIVISNISYIKDNSQTSFNSQLLRGNVVITDVNALNKYLIENKDVLQFIEIEQDTIKGKNEASIKIKNTSFFIKNTDDYIEDISNKCFFKDNEFYYFYITLLDNKGKYINSYPIPNKNGKYQHIISKRNSDESYNEIELDTFKIDISKFINHLKTNTSTEIQDAFNKVKSYCINYAKSNTDISNWISQCLIIRDIGINDVVGNNYKDPFKSASRFRIYPIEYLVTNTNIPEFYVKPLYHNIEAKVSYASMSGGMGDALDDYIDDTRNIEAIIEDIDSTDIDNKNEKIIALYKFISEKEKEYAENNNRNEGLGRYLGPWDRLSIYAKKNIDKNTKNVEILTNNDRTIEGPVETGDLVHSILDSETTEKADAISAGLISNIKFSASFYPINNSAISNAGCDSSFKFTIDNGNFEKAVFGDRKNAISKETDENSRIDIVLDYKEDKKIEEDGTIKITITETVIRYDTEETNDNNTLKYVKYDIVRTTIKINGIEQTSTEKTINKTYISEDTYNADTSTVKKGTTNDWILISRDRTWLDVDKFSIYDRGIIDLNKYDNITNIEDPDVWALNLVTASSIYPIETTKNIELKGDTFINLITQRCTCPSNKFNHIGDETHHNNSIHHCHRLIVTYYIKSRFNLLAMHSGVNSNSKIIKYQNRYANKFDINYIISNMSNWNRSDKIDKRTLDMFKGKYAEKVANFIKPNTYYSAIQELGYRDYTIDNFWHTSDGAAYEVGMNWKGFNDITQSKDYDSVLTKFPSRIVRSNVNNMESSDIGWRKYKADNYKDIPITKGSIINLLSDSKSLYIQMLYTLFVTSIKDSLNQGGADDTYIGTSDIFDRTPTEIIYKETGKIGCNSKFSSIINRYGYFVCDAEQGAIFHVKGENNVSELSDIGFKDWFKEHIKINNNPYDYKGNFLILDEYNKRLLFCHNVGYNVEFDKALKNNFYTISYNLQNNLWSSFHSYIPIIGFENRNGLYYLSNNGIFKTDAKNKCIYFDNTKHPSIIQFIYNEEPLISKAINHLEWRTQLVLNWLERNKDYIKYIYNKSVDKLMIHTDTQCTGLLDTKVKKEWYDDGHLKYKAGRYIWHNIEDKVKNDKTEMLLNPNMLPFNDMGLLNHEFKSKPWYEFSKIHNPFIYITMIYNNEVENILINKDGTTEEQQAEFRLSNVDIVVTKDTRL